jgi:hypothetical protein
MPRVDWYFAWHQNQVISMNRPGKRHGKRIARSAARLIYYNNHVLLYTVVIVYSHGKFIYAYLLI